jgi:hypothetical protein
MALMLLVEVSHNSLPVLPRAPQKGHKDDRINEAWHLNLQGRAGLLMTHV